ncbi:MAG: signal peptidase II [Melioribacter sp.]|nr:signal peptidase II [Melioribacter sp.]
MKVLYSTLFIVITDQITKFLVKGGTIPVLNIHVDGMYYGQSINVIGDFFKLTFVENPGLAFGIEVGDSSKLMLSLFTLLASIGIFYYLYKSRHQKLIVRLSLAFILGGAVGNLIDRTFYGLFYGYSPIFYGRVVDFFNVDFFDFTILGRTFDRWPIFNIADATVTIGVILLLIFHRTEPVKEQEAVKDIDDQKPQDAIADISVASETNNLEMNDSLTNNVEDNIRKEN